MKTARIGVASVLLLAACGGSPSAPPAQASAPKAMPPIPPIGSVADAGAAPVAMPPKRPSVCRAVGAGEVSDDETPTLAGPRGSAELLSWLDAHGVRKDAALAWLVARYRLPDAAYAESVFGPMPCAPLTVGDKAEEALVCHHSIPNPSVLQHAVVVVVRGGRIVPVLSVGLGVTALDFPDAHTLDLALEIAPDGRAVTLRERAPEGTKLVLAPSSCHAQEAHWEECDAKLAAEPDPERFAHPNPRGNEYIEAFEGCALHRGRDGKIAVSRLDPYAAPFGAPVVLHGCEAARARLAQTTRDVATADASIRKEVRETAAFVEKSCAQRGTWAWQGDRFVKK